MSVPRISVVVPIYNVESYLAACLDSVVRQSVEDLEVVMVNDGSTDGSEAIAEAYAARDARFRLVNQENGGLSAARNSGMGVAAGEFLAFLDSDDVLPPNAYELLLGALDQSGSDFATGNVHRLTRWGTYQAAFLARTFARTELTTHVTRFRPLIADRIAWNKLWRRSFWDRHRYRFPEGRLHEDIPIVVPAHFAARSVDVIADPVYYWRVREGGELSITQRRLEQRALLDRLSAVEDVSRHLARSGPRRAKRWYDESVVADDLRLHLNVLDRADDEYRELFLDRVNAFLDGASPRIYNRLAAIDRLKWHLVRRRLMPELLEVLRFDKEELGGTPPVRLRRRWYGDYPFRGDARLRIPRSVFRLKHADLPGSAHLGELRRDGNELKVSGFAYVTGIGAPAPDSQRVRVTALRPGRLRRVRLRLNPLRLKTVAIPRPDATARSMQPLNDLSWSGFEATMHPRALHRRSRREEESWELYVTVSAGGIRRRRARFVIDPARPLRAVELPGGEDAVLRAVPTEAAGVNLDVHRRWATVDAVALSGVDSLELSGTIRPAVPPKAKLELRRRADAVARRYPLTPGESGSASRFRARVSLGDLAAAGPPPEDETGADREEGIAWQLSVVGAGRRVPVLLSSTVARGVWRPGAREVGLVETAQGDAALVERTPRAVVTGGGWTDDGRLELEGELPAPAAVELVLRNRDGIQEHVFPLRTDGSRFTGAITPARVESLAGALPLRHGTWRLNLRSATGSGAAPEAPLMAARALLERMPLETVVAHKGFAFGATAQDCAALVVERDLPDDERGPYHQRRLRTTAYLSQRDQPVRDAVVYFSFGGRQCSDSPRAIHEELVRRRAPLEHLWVVRDGACQVPSSAGVLRDGSREFHQALARARFLVANDHLPTWFRRRDDQVCLQTLHGTPLRRQGFDLAAHRGKARRLLRGLDQQVANWQYLVSPNRYSTPILRGAYGLEDGLIETGLPRTDALAGPERDAHRHRVRGRLGLPDDVRVVLYAPTYRDDAVDRRGRYRLDLRVDLEQLRRAAGDDAIVLFRKHPFITDASPPTGDVRVRDVSAYPDATELLLATDVLITDYSSLMVDFANTGRPMLFFAYDLDAYEEAVRGFYVDFAETVPGPLLLTSDELTQAVRDPDGACAGYARRYERFVATFCELDDGNAAARVCDRVFAW